MYERMVLFFTVCLGNEMKMRKQFILWSLSLSALLPTSGVAEFEMEAGASLGYKQVKEEQKYTWEKGAVEQNIEKQKYIPLSFRLRFCEDFFAEIEGTYGFPVGDASWTQKARGALSIFGEADTLPPSLKTLLDTHLIDRIGVKGKPHPFTEVNARGGYLFEVSENFRLGPVAEMFYEHRKGGIKSEANSADLFPKAGRVGFRLGVMGCASFDQGSFEVAAKYLHSRGKGPKTIVPHVLQWENPVSFNANGFGLSAKGCYEVCEGCKFGLGVKYAYLSSKKDKNVQARAMSKFGQQDLFNIPFNLERQKYLVTQARAGLLAVQTTNPFPDRRTTAGSTSLGIARLEIFDLLGDNANPAVPNLWDINPGAGNNATFPANTPIPANWFMPMVAAYQDANLGTDAQFTENINSELFKKYFEGIFGTEHDGVEKRAHKLAWETINREQAISDNAELQAYVDKMEKEKAKYENKKHDFSVSMVLSWDF